MPCRVGIFGTEDGADAHHALSTTGNLKLLVELRRLSEESLLAKVAQLENVGATLRGGTNEARRLKLLEAVFLEVPAEQLLDFDANIL